MEIDRKKLPSYVMILVIIVVAVFFNFSYFNNHISANDEKILDYDLTDEDVYPIRETAVAGLFYPADMYQLDKDLNGYLEHVHSDLSGRPHIMIVPHAGYKFSAQVAAYAYKKLEPFSGKIKKVFILGPSHTVAFNGVALSPDKAFKTPLGIVKTDDDITQNLRKNPLFITSAKAHKKEHALEVQLPFLQKTLKNFTIIPMVYGNANPNDVAKALQPYIKNDDTVLIISADLSHYLDYETAQQVDKQTAKQIQNSEPVDYHQSCGATGINTAMILAKDFGFVPRLLDMVNSGDVSDDKSRVVGYGAWAYQKKNEPEELSGIMLQEEHLKNFARHYKTQLVDIVKKSLAAAVNTRTIYHPEREIYNEVLFDKGAAFVTLEKNGRLRGCIGSLYPNKAIADDIAENTFNAANSDPRFKPVEPNEIKDIDFTVSLLTGFEEIKFKSYDELIEIIEPNVDGLLIRDGQREGLFLPSVWKEIPDKQEFMTQLKIKAGLSPSHWSEKTKVFRFRTVEIKDDNN